VCPLTTSKTRPTATTPGTALQLHIQLLMPSPAAPLAPAAREAPEASHHHHTTMTGPRVLLFKLHIILVLCRAAYSSSGMMPPQDQQAQPHTLQTARVQLTVQTLLVEVEVCQVTLPVAVAAL